MRKFSTLIALVAIVAMGQHAEAQYVLDDGTAESSLGLGGTGSDVYWLAQFNALAGAENITTISIAYGSNVNADPPVDGTASNIRIWSDPNGDGNPDDAVLLETVAGSITNSHTDTFIDYGVNQTFNTGDSFFVGFSVETYSTAQGNFAVGRDTDTDNSGRMWIAGNNDGNLIDPNNLSASNFYGTIGDFGFPGTFLIRATGGPGNVIPEPTTASLLALGLVGVMARRRR